jgi:hypothetical protein
MEITGQIWILYNAIDKKQTLPLSTVQMQKLLLSLKLKDLDAFFIWTPGWEEWKPLIPFVRSKQPYFVLTMVPHPPQKPVGKPRPNDSSKKFDPTAVLEDNRSIVAEVKHIDLYNDSETKELFIDMDDRFTEIESEDTKNKPPPADPFQDFSAEDIDVNAPFKLRDENGKNGIERRRSDRHDFKLEVVLISKGGKTFRSYSRNISLTGTLLENEVPKEFLNGEFELMIINRFESDKSKGRLYFQGKVVGDLKNPQRLTFRTANQKMETKLEELV